MGVPLVTSFYWIMNFNKQLVKTGKAKEVKMDYSHFSTFLIFSLVDTRVTVIKHWTKIKCQSVSSY